MHRLRRPTSPFALVALLALAALTLASCGDGNSGGDLSHSRASRLRSTLDSVEQRVNAGDCAGATAQAQTLQQQASDLPRRVDRKLQEALIAGAGRLQQLVASQCQAAEATTGATGATGTTGTETVPQSDQQQNQKENKSGKPKKEKGPKKQKGPKDVPPGQQGTEPNQTPNGNGGSDGGLGDQQSGGVSP